MIEFRACVRKSRCGEKTPRRKESCQPRSALYALGDRHARGGVNFAARVAVDVPRPLWRLAYSSRHPEKLRECLVWHAPIRKASNNWRKKGSPLKPRYWPASSGRMIPTSQKSPRTKCPRTTFLPNTTANDSASPAAAARRSTFRVAGALRQICRGGLQLRLDCQAQAANPFANLLRLGVRKV